MKYLVVSDIWGQTSALDEFAQALAVLGSVEVIQPYPKAPTHFDTEQEAYQCFTQTVGLENYCHQLKNKISHIEEPVFLIGFSVGASAIWCLSEAFQSDKISGAIGFYSSQIRNHVTIEPNFPIFLIFPEIEKHFNLEKVISQLSHKGNTRCEKLPYLHGFMNKCSPNFDLVGYEKTLNTMIDALPENPLKILF